MRAYLTGAERQTARFYVAEQYVENELPVRVIAAELGISFGCVYRLLQEAQVNMRPRGGAYRKGRPQA